MWRLMFCAAGIRVPRDRHQLTRMTGFPADLLIEVSEMAENLLFRSAMEDKYCFALPIPVRF